MRWLLPWYIRQGVGTSRVWCEAAWLSILQFPGSCPRRQCRPLFLFSLLPQGCSSSYIDQPLLTIRISSNRWHMSPIPATGPSVVEPQRRSQRWHSPIWSPWAMYHPTANARTTECPVLECHPGGFVSVCRHVRCVFRQKWPPTPPAESTGWLCPQCRM